MPPRDTARAAHDAQVQWYRRLTPAARVELAASMSDDVRALALAGIRARHADYTREQAALALARLLLGDETYRRAWPDAPLLPP
ncbi:MAG TPA: hypothetical protein VK698_20335 [Kofleriaceae bacterium]|nr:hypothetical protein [Kofleriaceae bacterium]